MLDMYVQKNYDKIQGKDGLVQKAKEEINLMRPQIDEYFYDVPLWAEHGFMRRQNENV